MLLVASDLFGLDGSSDQTPVVVIRNHEDDAIEGILLLGIEGIEQTTKGLTDDIVPDDWRVALRDDSLLFAPSGAANTSLFDSGIIRDESGALTLRSFGSDAVTVDRDSVSIEGNLILDVTTDAGDPEGVEGMLSINISDNTIKLFAEGEWRILAEW